MSGVVCYSVGLVKTQAQQGIHFNTVKKKKELKAGFHNEVLKQRNTALGFTDCEEESGKRWWEGEEKTTFTHCLETFSLTWCDIQSE